MAIFNESYLDKHGKSKKNVGKTVYKPEHKSTKNNIGDKFATTFKQTFMTAKEACALAIEDAFSIDYPESNRVQVKKSKLKNQNKEYCIYKATIVDENYGLIYIKLESLEATGSIKELASKYGFTIEASEGEGKSKE